MISGLSMIYSITILNPDILFDVLLDISLSISYPLNTAVKICEIVNLPLGLMPQFTNLSQPESE
jgi:hypothetical protein